MNTGSRSPIADSPLLQAVAIQRLAEGGAVLLDDVSLELSAGDRLALAGTSGSGKSLLLRALALLDPLDGGSIHWRGTPPAGDTIPRYRRNVIYLAQNPVIDDAPVAEQLARPWSYRSAGKRRFDRGRAEDLLRRAGKEPDFLGQSGANLSGGEAQLVALVRALLIQPCALLLDEPTAAMDADTRRAAESLVNDWMAAGEDRALVWVSHDPAQLDRMCDLKSKIASGKLEGLAA